MPCPASARGTASVRVQLLWPISTERIEITDATPNSSAAPPTAPIVSAPDGLTAVAHTGGLRVADARDDPARAAAFEVQQERIWRAFGVLQRCDGASASR